MVDAFPHRRWKIQVCMTPRNSLGCPLTANRRRIQHQREKSLKSRGKPAVTNQGKILGFVPWMIYFLKAFQFVANACTTSSARTLLKRLPRPSQDMPPGLFTVAQMRNVVLTVGQLKRTHVALGVRLGRKPQTAEMVGAVLVLHDL